MMTWEKLLSVARVAELFGKPASVGDSRTEFERDYGRVLFSTPFRRLQDKTQVFPLEQHDSVRTRLTHSLEVSSVARSLGKLAASWMVAEGLIDPEKLDDIQTLAATCGLLHDLGNPPFGHSGERAIQSWFAKNKLILDPLKDSPLRSQLNNDFLLFEGNAQTIRLLSTIQLMSYEQQYTEYGLNLTCASFSVASKYISASDRIDSNNDKSKRNHSMAKPGYFASEEEVINFVREKTGTGAARHPISYLVEACDDLVYCTGDLEDSLKKGLVGWDEVRSELLYLSDGDAVVVNVLEWSEKKVNYIQEDRGRRDELVIQAFRTYAMNAIKHAALEIFKNRYKAIMFGQYTHELARDENCKTTRLLDACQAFLRSRIFPLHEVTRVEIMGRKVIHDLMDLFWEAVEACSEGEAEPRDKRSFPAQIFDLISTNYRQAFERGVRLRKLPEQYCRLQLVADQIAGMTDTHACSLHRQLMNGGH
ncbi:MAG: dGTP triphosphohydrolase [Terracidiphilus sp.]|jgi:dGTPase